MELKNNKILITGGASGIGFAMAERFIREGNTVIICGRRESALQEAKDKLPSLITRPCDVSDESGREELYKWIEQEHAGLNVLVNNAGIQNWMKPGDAGFYEKAKAEISTNIEAPLHLSLLFMNLKSLNTIMNVTSGLAFFPFIKVPVYSATKAFFHSFTLSLRALVKDKNIEVVEVIPPALNTDLGGKGLHDHATPVSDFIEAIFEQLKNGSNEVSFGMSATVSKAGQEILKPAFNNLNQVSQ